MIKWGLTPPALKADGRWAEAYDSPKTAVVPPELATALIRNKRAPAAFERLSKSERYSMLHKIQTAKRPETRARRIAAIIEVLASA